MIHTSSLRHRIADTEIKIERLEAQITSLRQDKAELLEKGQALLTALDTDQYGRITDDCIEAFEAAINKARKES